MSVFHETYHVHTSFCDGENTVEEVAAAAFEQGIKILGFSGHSFIPKVGEYGMEPAKERAYIAAVAEAKAQYAGKMDILCGMELDAYSAKPTYIYDYLIGSVHCIPTSDGLKDVDNGAALQKQVTDAFFGGDFYAYTKAYFEEVAQVRKKTDCTVIGHFDLVSKYNEQAHFFDETDARYLSAGIDAIHTLCEKPDAVFEINTGALPRGARATPYPAHPFLKAIKQAGGRIIFSSDSHNVNTLLFGGERMIEVAKAAGFESRVSILPDGRLHEVGI